MTESNRGRLIQIREAAARGGMSVETLRRRLLDGRGPPALKLPGSQRWVFYTGEFDAWIESGRVKQSA